MKILQLNKFYYPTLGGIETIVKQVSEGLGKSDNWQVDVLTCNVKTNIQNITENINGVTVFRAKSLGVFLSMPISIEYLLWFRKIVKQYDLVLLHHPFPLGFLAFWLFGKNKKMIVWYFSDIVRQCFTGILFRPLLITVLKKANIIIVYSRSLVSSSSVLGRFKDKVKVIPYGLLKLYDNTPINGSNIIGDLNVDQNIPIILSVGRLVSYKGFEVLIDAINGVSATLLIIGDGPLYSNLTEQIISQKLASKIKIIRSVKDLSPYYTAADFFVLPSITIAETFGVVQLEAMSYGLPVINTALPTAVPEVSLDGLTGITVQPGSVEQLHDAIVELVNNKTLRGQYSEAAKLRVENEFNESKFLENLKQEIEKIYYD